MGCRMLFLILVADDARMAPRIAKAMILSLGICKDGYFLFDHQVKIECDI